MSLISILLTLIIVGFILWVVSTAPIIDGWIKNVIYGVVVIAVLIWLLQGFGLIHGTYFKL